MCERMESEDRDASLRKSHRGHGGGEVEEADGKRPSNRVSGMTSVAGYGMAD
jgi:hypothetical protein